MRTVVVIGHRGVGKSSLLRRWQGYVQKTTRFYDLDAEVEKATGKSISSLFEEEGESYFRKIEKQVFDQLIIDHQKEPTLFQVLIIAVGGGFDPGHIPSDAEVLWLRRDLDSEGRAFTDRPRLSIDLDPIAEFQGRFQKREPKFEKAAEKVYTIPEGLLELDADEKVILTEEELQLDAFLTLNERHLRFKPNFLNCHYEIRDDILNPDQIKTVASLFSNENLLYSVRSTPDLPEVIQSKKIKVDWDLKFKLKSHITPFIVSTHENDIRVAIQDLAIFEKQDVHLKLCPLVTSFDHLKLGYEWFQKDSRHRSFLPRSLDGRWSWFRLFMKNRQLINFVREGAGSTYDQPTLWEWLSTPAQPMTFAAILGSPVRHSYSPTYHKNFFKTYNMPFLRIPLDQAEWPQAFPVLDQIGLRAAAVTSPLKEMAGGLVGQSSLNTLVKSSKGWLGTNTDISGARELLAPYADREIVVWGGGGVLESLRSSLKRAQFYSVRTGLPRDGSNTVESPECVIWAAPDGGLQNLPPKWTPRFVVDLNYKQNSEGLLYALRIGAQYVSGLKMFQVQGDVQQKFWAQYLKT